jgi:PilZ domain
VTPGPERRGDVRVRWRTRVSFTRAEADGGVVEGESRNMSSSGAAVVTPAAFDVGEEIVVEVVSADPPLSMRRLARVTRCRRDRGGFTQAIRFEPASARSRAELLAALIIVASRSGQRLPPQPAGRE